MTRVLLWISVIGAVVWMVCGTSIQGQPFSPNHPELEWFTISTDHFYVHYYDGTERSARVAGKIAEEVYGPVTGLYHVELDSRIHLILKDTDDYSNGAAYYYDNKIVIWAMPLDFELRGSHNWLRDVITHELTHIIQLNAAMKFTRKVPATYLQWIHPEQEHRDDVLYGFPSTIISYPIAGTVIPPWFAEGVAQYNVRAAPYDYWDTHRDMILRDRVLSNNLLRWNEMNTFGKSGVGNESVYNQGFALVQYIARRYGDESLFKVTDAMRSPFAVSFNKAIGRVLGKSGRELYADWADSLYKRYELKTRTIRHHDKHVQSLSRQSSGNFYPRWSPRSDSVIAVLTNRGNDYLSQTGLFLYNRYTETFTPVAESATSGAGWAPDGSAVVYARKSPPDRYGSVYDDLYRYDFDTEEESRLTNEERVKNPDWSPRDSVVVFVSSHDGTQNLYLYSFPDDSIRQLTRYDSGEQIYSPRFSRDGTSIVFDMNRTFGRDIYRFNLADSTLDVLVDHEFDARNPALAGDTLTFADDRTGIFNIYQKDLNSGEVRPITNVSGGAFMPDIRHGMLLVSHYDHAGYQLGLSRNIIAIESQKLKYRKMERAVPEVNYDDSQYLTHKETEYEPHYSHMFLVPRLMVEYGTLKPGLYFFSNEILDKMGVMGGASVNRQADIDLYLSFNYNQFRPSLYADFTYLTRNITEDIYFIDKNSPKEEANLRFTLIQSNIGMDGEWYRYPWGEFRWNVYARVEQYSTFIKYLIPSELIDQNQNLQKLRYEYYKGKQIHTAIEIPIILERTRRVSYISAGNNLGLDLHYSYEWNDFFEDFEISSESGILQTVYSENNTHRIEADLNGGLRLPIWENSTLSGRLKAGWLSYDKIDDFFHFFGGGLPGLKGYPFYSFSGSRLLLGTFQWRIPVFTEVNWRFFAFNFQDVFIGPYLQAGDSWSGGLENARWKRTVGMEMRLGGFSFYSYPTAITMDWAYGLDSFSIDEGTRPFGKEWRWYMTLLFEFESL